MEQFFSIGPINLPIKFIYIGFAILAAYFAMKFRLKTSNYHSKQLIDTIFNGVIIGWVVWKLSYVLFHPVYAFTNPLGILYFDGGRKGIILALVLGFIYLYFKSYKQKVSIIVYIDLFSTGLFTGTIVFYFYQVSMNVIYHIGQIGLAFLLLLAIFNYVKEVGSWKRLSTIILLYSLGQIFVQYFSNHYLVFFHLTLGQVIFCIVILITLALQNKGGETHR
ncbi:hypothetical protein BTR23_24010 [Alkalihalophilus pseudofirmus]|nr:hypothetical protein BTR23_24010 [Alkalihalophilus pseudofirmus]